MIKVGIVVQRYGQEVVGGAETLSRDIAERLTYIGFDVTVFTTTAKDYITWKNYYKTGESILRGVIIKRFIVEKERDIKNFNHFSESFFKISPEQRDEAKWVIEQGPYSTDLIKEIEKEQNNFDIFIFFTYLYFTTIEGLKVIKKPTILFPTAHDESPIYLFLMRQVFKKPDAIFFLTGAEMKFVKKTFDPSKKMKLIRTGIDIKKNVKVKLFKEKYHLYAPYMLYAGRIERGKGLELVFKAFDKIRKKRLIDLILIGKKLMDIPEIDRLRYIGFVSEEEKLSAFKGAVFSIQPSPLESLSITTLESFSQKTPVLVNKKSEVLFEHILMSKGGFAYNNFDELIQNFYILYDNRRLRKKMGLNGYNYVQKDYSWEIVTNKISEELKTLIR